MIAQQRRNKSITGGVTAGSQVYKAIYDFEPTDKRQLAFKKGDEILVLRKQVEAGKAWWEGRCNGKSGLIPKKYVELMHDGQAKSGHEKKEALNPPVGITVASTTSSTVVLSWTAPKTSIKINEYFVIFTEGEERDQHIRKVSGDSTTFVLEGLKPKTKYTVKMKSHGEGKSSKLSFGVECKTDKHSKHEKKRPDKDAPPVVPEMKLDKKQTALSETVNYLEALHIFFGTQASFLKEMSEVMKKTTYGANQTITGKTGTGKNSQHKKIGNTNIQNKEVGQMHALFLLNHGRARLLNRDGIAVQKVETGTCMLGTRSKLVAISETRHDGQEGDIVTAGKCVVLELMNFQLEDLLRKYPQSQSAIMSNAMHIITGHLADLILLTHQQTVSMMGDMQARSMGIQGRGGGGGGGSMMMGGGGAMMAQGRAGQGGSAGSGYGHGGTAGAAAGRDGGVSISDFAGSGRGAQGMLTPGGQPMPGMRTQLDAEVAVKELRQKLQWMPMFRDAPGQFLDKMVRCDHSISTPFAAVLRFCSIESTAPGALRFR